MIPAYGLMDKSVPLLRPDEKFAGYSQFGNRPPVAGEPWTVKREL
jgi:hypothetical protein